jgi:two-component system cell cycle response regulator DivK
MTKIRILHIEDTVECQQLVSAVLTHYGYEVFRADDGEQGIEMARSLAPDLILMDLHLPGIDGLEATRQIKAILAMSSVPIIALTAADEAADCQRALAAGCLAYLGKPFSPSELVALVRQCCSSATARA